MESAGPSAARRSPSTFPSRSVLAALAATRAARAVGGASLACRLTSFGSEGDADLSVKLSVIAPKTR
jgi:hypothetical protein